MNKFILKNGSGSLCPKSCGRQDNKLNTYDWLADIPNNDEIQDMVEIQFKNTRKGYYKNSNKLKLEKGDIVAVEANPGHDTARRFPRRRLHAPVGVYRPCFSSFLRKCAA